MSIRDSLLAFVIILVWGVNFVVIAWGLEGMPPILMGCLRFLLVAVLGCWFVSRPQIPLRWIIIYALTLGFAQFAFLFTAMAVGMPAGLASLVLQSQALFTLFFAVFMLKEQIKGYQIIAMLIAGVGLVLIGTTSQTASITMLGFSMTIAAAISWALGNIVTRIMSQRGYQPNVNLVIWSSWISALAFFICAWLVEGPVLMLVSMKQINGVSIASLLYLAVVATVLGYSLWTYLLSNYPAGKVAPLTLGVPVVGLVSANVLLGEEFSQQQMIGITLIMLGLMVNMRLDRQLSKLLRS